MTSTLRLHHIGIVVADLGRARTQYAALGFGDGEASSMPDQGVNVVTYATGSGFVELIQPTDADGPIARFMTKRGEGLHHVAYQVDDLITELAQLAARGVRLIDSAPRTGVHGWGIAFIHPESCNGVLTELVQVNEPDTQSS